MLLIPHPRNIRKLIGAFSLTDWSIEGSINYLKSKLKLLKENELIVNVHIDEIYINPQLNFKAGTIFGSSEDNPTCVAKRAQVCMLSGVISNYKDVVTIVPVSHMTALQLYGLLIKVIQEIENIGFRVIALVSDNNCINRKAFEHFSVSQKLESVVPHPCDSDRKLFFIFDAVHIIKCIRNNWISKRNLSNCLTFPDFDNFDATSVAKFKHLETLYQNEKNALVKFGHTLSYKAIYPTSIEKQNVNLALAIFNEKNIAALECVSKENENFSGFEGTCQFLHIICSWWKIANVKSVFEGRRFNDNFREPIRQGGDFQLQFLQKLSSWLKAWRINMPTNESLSAETFQAFIITVDSFIHLIHYMFSAYKVDYLLLSKFQNDVLEGRFGCYRQLSGANYHISFLQLIESERKLRFKSVVLLAGKNGNVPLTTLLPCCDEPQTSVDITPFNSVLKSEFSIQCIPEEVLPILSYIAGYVVRHEIRQQNCELCVSWLQSKKTVDVEIPPEFKLIEALDRGKLMLPSELSLIAICVVWFVMQIIVDNFKGKFLACKNQLGLLKKLTSQILTNYLKDCNTRMLIDSEESCLCSCKVAIKLVNISNRGCKIMLNNFVKNENDEKRCNTDRKLKKFKTA